MDLFKHGFDKALVALKEGKKVTRVAWNDNRITIQLQIPDLNSKMTKPYLYLDKIGSIYPTDLNSESLMAEDWIIID